MSPAAAPLHISSRSNPLVRELRRLSHDNMAYRKQGRIWIEGKHLCEAALAQALVPEMAVFSASGWEQAAPVFRAAARRNVVLDDALMASISNLPSPAGLAFVLPYADETPEIAPLAPSVVLDRVQDAGNVGSILRCAAAFGYRQVLALTGTAGLWSSKVLRAGAGAHFALRLIEGLEVEQLVQLAIPLVTTSSHEGQWLHEADLPWPCAWLLGHEGQGVAPALAVLAMEQVRIAQPGGQESLNVAAAAAICLHARRAPP